LLRSVFPLNKGNKEKLNVAREEEVWQQEGKTGRRMTRKPDYYRLSSKWNEFWMKRKGWGQTQRTEVKAKEDI
jgi:hypothetical protein